jgi:hypothetical protein
VREYLAQLGIKRLQDLIGELIVGRLLIGGHRFTKFRG